MTTLPDHAPDVWTPATDIDKEKALVILGDLPSRNANDAALSHAVYMLALDGVTAYGLDKAVRAIVQGSLGHAFAPSPPELRQEIDRAMRPLVEARERDTERSNRRVGWAEDRSEKFEPNSRESRRRVAALYREFCRTWPASEGRAEAPSGVLLDPDKVAKIPDAPRSARPLGEILRPRAKSPPATTDGPGVNPGGAKQRSAP